MDKMSVNAMFWTILYNLERKKQDIISITVIIIGKKPDVAG